MGMSKQTFIASLALLAFLALAVLLLSPVGETLLTAVSLFQAPSNLTVTHNPENGHLALRWTDNNPKEAFFAIGRSSTSARYGWSPLATVGANVTTYTDTTTEPGKTYYYRVRAVRGGTSSAFSNVASATALVAPSSPSSSPSPTAPSSVSITLPTAADTYTTNRNSITLAGVVSSDITSVTWANAYRTPPTGSTTLTGTIWHATIPLAPGSNGIVVTAKNALNQTVVDFITVTYTAPTAASPTPSPSGFDFLLFSARTVSAIQQSSVSNSITATFIAGTPRAPSFRVSGVPHLAHSRFSSVTCSASQCTSTLTVSPTTLTPVGTYTIVVTGTSGGLTRNTSFTFQVRPQPLPAPLACAAGETYVSIPIASSEDDAEAGGFSSVSYKDITSCTDFTSTHGTDEITRSKGGNGLWHVFTGLLRFNTNTLPRGAVVTKARLGINLQLVLAQKDNFDLLVHYYPTAPAGAFSCNDWSKNPEGPFAASYPLSSITFGQQRWTNLALANPGNIVPGRKTSFRFWAGDGSVEPTGDNFPEFTNYDFKATSGTVPYLELCYQPPR